MNAGVRTPYIDLVSLADQIIVNREGSTGLQPIASLATQLLNSSAFITAFSANAAGLVRASSLAALNAIPGTRNGQPGEVTAGADIGAYAWSGSAWGKVGDIISPAAVAASLFGKSIGVKTATLLPIGTTSSFTVKWTQGRGNYNGSVAMLADLPTTTLASTEILYIDLAGGSSPYAVTKANTSSGLRQDAEAGRKLILLGNQTGSIYGALKENLLSVMKSQQWDASEMVVAVSTDLISIYQKCSANPKSRKYYRWRLIKLNVGSGMGDGSDTDVWVIQGVYETERLTEENFLAIRQVVDFGNMELAVREQGKPDAMGGSQHGDEKLFGPSPVPAADGKALEITPTLTYYSCRTFSFWQSSLLYEAGTTTPASVISAEVFKRYEWSNGEFVLQVGGLFKRAMNTIFTFLGGMLGVNRVDPSDTGYPISNAAWAFMPITYLDVSAANVVNVKTPAGTQKLQGPNGHSFEIDVLEGWDKAGRLSHISRDAGRNKAYFNHYGESYNTSVDEPFYQKTRYRLGLLE